MELIEDRHGKKSTIITSQLPVNKWYDVLSKNSAIADVILDRLVIRAMGTDSVDPDDPVRSKWVNGTCPNDSIPYYSNKLSSVTSDCTMME